ncbi:DUF2470 domain-containing protein [Mycobacterium sp. 1274756.6]|uniref:DUF2470 domain-containing protein n=1 Tax=Mycobacterium sp. 1274756.6 TaxID=1834076 RepID=UPI0007FE9CBF|nr:DUF2470 domain-containing protein [Mycobacterium sp. 1274756.6]OBJ72247.1 DUF2470 domain-containing protein [Mycobacterium sp. 1274756.6]
MTRIAVAAPTTAERIRSACARADGALLAVDGLTPVTTPVHHLLADGSFAMAVPADLPVGSAVPAMVELTDQAPLRLRTPVRALVWLRGRLEPVAPAAVPDLLDQIAAENPDPALLRVQTPRTGPPHDPDVCYRLVRLAVESVVVADAGGAEAIGVPELLAAAPDPFCATEAGWLRHLETAHPEVMARLAARLPTRLRRGTVRPLALDRYGVSLRVEDATGDHDVRLPFHRPVDDARGLGQAIRLLMGCPFLAGLRPRQG